MADDPKWACGECEAPVKVGRGKEWRFYRCDCGAQVSVRPGSKTDKAMEKAGVGADH
jgi:hypothetical protein